MSVVRELLTALGFEVDEAQADAYDRRLSGLAAKAERISDRVGRAGAKAMDKVGRATVQLTTAAVGAAAAAGTAAVVAFTKSINDIEDMSRNIEISGLDAATFQTWGQVASDELGWAGDKFADVMKDVNDRVGQLTGEGAGELKGLIDAYGKAAGMSAKDFVGGDAVGTVTKVAQMLAKAGASQAEITAAGEALANDGSVLLKLAMRENGELERKLALAQQGLQLSEDEIKAAKQLQTARRKLAGWLDDIRFKISAGLAPVLTRLLDKWNEWLVANKELVSLRIEQAIGIGTRALETAGRVFDKVGTAVTWVTDKLGGFENVARSLAAVLTGALAVAGVAAFAWIAPALPGLAVAAFLLGALGYAIQDVYTWINGGDSVIGRWLGSWVDFTTRITAEWSAAWANIKQGFANIGAAWDSVVGAIGGAWTAFTGRLASEWEAAKAGVVAAFNDLAAGWQNITDAMGAVWDTLWGLLPAAVQGAVTGIFQPMKDAWDGALGWMGDQWDALWGRIGGAISGAVSSIRSAFGGASEDAQAYTPNAIAERHRKKTGQQKTVGANGSNAPVVEFGGGTRIDGTNAAGGPVSRGGLYLVGEEGPELVEMGGNGFVTPARQTRTVLDSWLDRTAGLGGRMAAGVAAAGVALGPVAAAAGTPPPAQQAAWMAPAGSGGGINFGNISVNAPVTIERGAIPAGVSEERVAELISRQARDEAEKVLGRAVSNAVRHFTEQEEAPWRT